LKRQRGTKGLNRMPIIAIAVLMLLPFRAHACLSADDIATLEQLGAATNVSFEALHETFASVCSLIRQVNETAQNHTEPANFSAYYNATETEALVANRTERFANATDLETLSDRVEGIQNVFITNETIKYWNMELNSTLMQFNDTLEERRAILDDLWDEKVSGLDKVYITEFEFGNSTAELKRIIYAQPSKMDIYAPYLFLLALAAIGGTVAYKWVPDEVKGKWIRDARLDKHRIEEVTTESKLKKGRESMAGLKEQVAKMKKPKLDKAQKMQLLQMINDRLITDTEELDKEVELLGRIRAG
jgi:hypothetical protein